VLSCSVTPVNDECKTLNGLGHAVNFKQRDAVDMFFAAPCSLGKFLFLIVAMIATVFVVEISAVNEIVRESSQKISYKMAPFC